MIYDKAEEARPSRLGTTGVSLVVHGALISLVLVGSAIQRAAKVDAPVEVKFVGKGSAGKPPPPPPPGKSKPKRRPTQVTKIEVPKVMPQVKPPEPVPEKEAPKEEAAGTEGGVQGGVQGGVVGGVVGGMVGGTGGGGTEPPPAPKVKNVPAFVMKGKAIKLPNPHIRNEAFRQSHRGQTINGLFKVCAGLDGKVYEVTPVKPVGGVDEEIMEYIREEWLFQPQTSNVCFTYGFDYIFQ